MRFPVLVVDDCEIVAASVCRVLERAGFDVTMAHSCAEARKLAQKRQYLVGIVDVSLGDGSGLDLADWLCEHEHVGRAVFHTGSPLSGAELESACRSGFVVLKGRSSRFLLKAVVEAIRAVLNRQLHVLDDISRQASLRPEGSGAGSGPHRRPTSVRPSRPARVRPSRPSRG